MQVIHGAREESVGELEESAWFLEVCTCIEEDKLKVTERWCWI